MWDLNDSGDWTFSGSEWQAHKGSVNRVAWAHPEFGQLLATCGTDHAATVWEEREGGLGLPSSAPTAGDVIPPASAAAGGGVGGGGGSPTTRWVAKAQLTDARKSVTCLQFAPRHLGLKLATGSADGSVRIFEAIDVMNLNHWPLNGTIEVESPSSSSTSDAGSSASGLRVSDASGGKGSGSSGQGELGVSALSWCTGRFEPPSLVVGGSSGASTVYRYSDASRAWGVAVNLPRHPGGVLDVAWAPNVGRSYHLVATCGRDNVLRVHRLKRGRKETADAAAAGGRGEGGGGGSSGGRGGRVGTSDSDASKMAQAMAGTATLELESSQVLDAGTSGEVWRVEWNVTGTVLACAGDGGVVRLWKSDFQGNWRCVSEVHGDTGGGS